MKKPKFSGLPKDAAQFVRDWTEVETIIQSSSSYPVSDFALLLELRGCLDEASSEVLKTRMIYEKNLGYQEYWDSFRQEWGIDMLKQNRMDWYAVKLIPTGPRGSEVTLGDWRKFQAKFATARARVADRTWSEEHRLVFLQLTEKMQQALLREQAKRRATKPWVSANFHEGARLAEILEELTEALGRPLPSHVSTKTGCIFRCKDKEMRNALLRFSDWEFDGHSVELTRYEYEMSGDEIFEFFLERLRTEQELEATRQSYGCEATQPKGESSEHPQPKVTVTSQGDKESSSPPMDETSNKNSAAKKSAITEVKQGTTKPPRMTQAQKRAAALAVWKEKEREVIKQEVMAMQSRAFDGNPNRSSPRRTQSPRDNRDQRLPPRQSWGSAKGVPRNPDECWACADLKLPADHYYKKCPKHQEALDRRFARDDRTTRLVLELLKARSSSEKPVDASPTADTSK
jgi:hypothetical protein